MMGIWDVYDERTSVRGTTRREISKRREIRYLDTKLPGNLSYHDVTINGVKQNVAIIDSDNIGEKYIHSMPNEDIELGSLVYWMDNHWLVTERDVNTEIRTKCIMLQCNYLLKWVDDDDVIHEQWCVVEDGTKYLTGEYEDRHFIVTRGDSRIAITIGRNEHTVKLGRKNRFLVDDLESPKMLAYELSKPLKFSGVYNGKGVFKFVLQEVVSTDDDNFELGIADYYKHFPRDYDGVRESDFGVVNTDNLGEEDSSGKKVWL